METGCAFFAVSVKSRHIVILFLKIITTLHPQFSNIISSNCTNPLEPKLVHIVYPSGIQSGVRVTPGGTRRHLRGYVDYTICITSIMY
jgi:hypothetical protein